MPDADLVKILAGAGVGGVALIVLYLLLKPLIGAIIESQREFVKQQAAFATTLSTIGTTMSAIREDIRASIDRDRQTDSEILLRLRDGSTICRFVPGTSSPHVYVGTPPQSAPPPVPGPAPGP